MDFEQRQSGLVVPKETAMPPPKRTYGSTEIQDESRRALVADALLALWDAMDLSHGGGSIRLQGEQTVEMREEYYRAYRFFGELLLGKDCPSREVLC